MATRLGKKLSEVRKSGELWWLRPDGKSQVTIEYLQKSDGSVEPQKVHTVVIATQHAAPGTTMAEETGSGEGVAPSVEEQNKEIVEKVVKRTLEEIILKNGENALSLYGEHTRLFINPAGRFVIGGPQGDAGSLEEKSSLIHMVVGVHMVAGPSLGRIRPKLTGLEHISADKWPSLW